MSLFVNNKKGKSLLLLGPHIVCFPLDVLSDSASGAFANPIKQLLLRVGTTPHQIQTDSGIGLECFVFPFKARNLGKPKKVFFQNALRFIGACRVLLRQQEADRMLESAGPRGKN